MSAFNDMMNRLKSKEGYSTDTARKVAAKIGDESIGKKEMAKRSAESRKKNENGDKPAEYDKFGALAHGATQAGYPPDEAAAMANKKTGTYTGDDED